MQSIDCRKMACPAPVLKTKETIENDHPDMLKVSVDNEAAKENVSRFFGSQGFEVSIKQEGENYFITGKKGEPKKSGTFGEAKEEPDSKKVMVMISTDKFGRGDDELGSKLLVNFIKTLNEMGDDLWRLVFVNNGVKLTAKGSNVLSELMALDTQENRILVCGTCLIHFNLMDKKQVGETTNMLDIVMAMQLADKVINI